MSSLDHIQPESVFCIRLCANETSTGIAACAIKGAIIELGTPADAPDQETIDTLRSEYMQGFCAVMRATASIEHDANTPSIES